MKGLTVTANGTGTEHDEAVPVLKGRSNKETSLRLLHIDRDASKGRDSADLYRPRNQDQMKASKFRRNPIMNGRGKYEHA